MEKNSLTGTEMEVPAADKIWHSKEEPTLKKFIGVLSGMTLCILAFTTAFAVNADVW